VICPCGCGTEFEPSWPGQRYLNATHRIRAQNLHTPVKRSKFSPVASEYGCGEPKPRCNSTVTEAKGSRGAQTSQGPQFLAPSEFSEFQSIDEIIQREKLLTAAELAGILGVRRATIKDWRQKRRKRGPQFVRISRMCVRYRLRDVRAWLDKLGVMPPGSKNLE
jgi:predicted DNA-binding transcriptional regulator AlpA